MATESNPLTNVDVTILASLARRLLPDPLSERPEPFLADLSPEEAAVLQQIVAEVGVTQKQLIESFHYRTEVLKKISTLMSTAALEGERGQAAARRLGSRGDLRLGLYKIRYGDLFKEFEKLGVRRNHVEEVIREPDSIQHVLPPEGADPDFPSISLIAKRIQPKRHSSFITLVQAERRNDELHIQAVWRLPESLAVGADAISPKRAERTTPQGKTLLEILGIFVRQFGLYIQLPNRIETQFVFYEAIPLGEAKPLDVVRVNNPRNASFLISFSLRVSPLNVAQVALGYAINTDSYRKEVRIEG